MVRELARQRLRFLPQLLRAAGHAGWVVLFDEVELIGRYSLLQRGRSYAELARWLDGNPGDEGEPLGAWINEWDLVRLDPGYRPITDVVDLPGSYGELDELDEQDDETS